jgi:transposase
MKKRQSFTREFKLEAVRLLEASGRSAAEVARELGIRRNQLYKWQEQLQAKGNSRPRTPEPARGRAGAA